MLATHLVQVCATHIRLRQCARGEGKFVMRREDVAVGRENIMTACQNISGKSGHDEIRRRKNLATKKTHVRWVWGRKKNVGWVRPPLKYLNIYHIGNKNVHRH